MTPDYLRSVARSMRRAENRETILRIADELEDVAAEAELQQTEAENLNTPDGSGDFAIDGKGEPQ